MARPTIIVCAAGALWLAACGHLRGPGTANTARGIARRFPAALPEVRDEDWPMFRDDLERSGFAEGSTVGRVVDALWHISVFNTTAYGAVKGSASVVGDMLYCGTDTGRFIAARTIDGQIVWEVRFEHTTQGVHGSPAIVGGVVYIGAYDGAVYAIDRQSGRVLWRHQVGDQVGSSPAVVPRWGVLFSAQEQLPRGGYVVALDARTGDELWRRPTEAHPHSSVAVDVSRFAVFVGDNHGTVYRFDALTGDELWRRTIDGPDGHVEIKTTPMVIPERGLVVFGSWSGSVYALDEATGRSVWERPTGGRIMASTAYLPARGLLYAATPRGLLDAINVATGEVWWTFRAGAGILSSPAVSGDGRAVVFGANDGKVYAVRADTGERLWDYFVGGQVSGSPTLVGNRIYVTSRNGGLWALTTRD